MAATTRARAGWQAEIKRASIEVGFFYVTGHNASRPLMSGILDAARQFFKFPEQNRKAIKVNAAHRGYVPYAESTLDRKYAVDLKHSFNFAWPFKPDDPESAPAGRCAASTSGPRARTPGARPSRITTRPCSKSARRCWRDSPSRWT
jgi:isopenicillin N synthase-like dioxygenase